MQAFLKEGKESFFILRGYAGTGKTFCIKALGELTRGRFVYTAPTNKATRVLLQTLKDDRFAPECRTIYSLLGLRLEPSGEVRELKTPEDPIDLSDYRAVIVDEGSMVNQVLMEEIRKCAGLHKIQFIFMGDPAQLPPVKEDTSPIWTCTEQVAVLERVMRHDNQILTLATKIRKTADSAFPRLDPFRQDCDAEGGIFTPPSLAEAIYQQVERFRASTDAKVIAWRNVTVDAFNKSIRWRLFGNTPPPWLPEDRVIFTAPAKDLDDQILATTDDEGTVAHVSEDFHPLYPEFRIYRVAVTLDDNRLATALVLHPSVLRTYERKVEQLAEQARQDKRKWIFFWDFKEAFHGLRHAYAITAHRSQGSTYTAAFVDYRDILLNRNRNEAFRCLYVACTRPKKELYLG